MWGGHAWKWRGGVQGRHPWKGGVVVYAVGVLDAGEDVTQLLNGVHLRVAEGVVRGCGGISFESIGQCVCCVGGFISRAGLWVCTCVQGEI